MTHIPVLKKEVLQYLNPQPNENFIDCTLGKAGHSMAILELTRPIGKVLGIDQDEESLKDVNENRLIKICENFSNLKEIVRENSFGPISGILLDLGMSSWHLEESGKGFSFLKDEPLDMRYSMDNALTAEKIINKWTFPELQEILKKYGEEKFSQRIAKEIKEARQRKKIETTFQLAEIIKRAIPLKNKLGINPATKTFQALRIAVNKELEALEMVLPQAMEVLEVGGRMAIISFHSLEDRIVKNFFREEQKKQHLEILTKKPIIASPEEILNNLRSRSAKLRLAKKIN